MRKAPGRAVTPGRPTKSYTNICVYPPHLRGPVCRAILLLYSE